MGFFPHKYVSAAASTKNDSNISVSARLKASEYVSEKNKGLFKLYFDGWLTSRQV
jgi:hypothetical protein